MSGTKGSGEAAKSRPVRNNGDLSLIQGLQGHQYRIVGISGCEAQTRLASMGILPGQNIRIVQLGGFGPVMVEVKGTRIALGHGISRKIIICPASG